MTVLADEVYMREALRLAERGRGWTSPNPVVGAVVVRGGMIVGRGYHERVGGPHAEVNALNEAGDQAVGATLYVTLEPCTHIGRTPPCVDLILERRVARVICGMVDPDSRVRGKGVGRLREAGVYVTVGVLEGEAQRLNEAYLKYATSRLPFVTLKLAQSLDGRIALASGKSKWITNEESRRRVHAMRAAVDAVMVGIGTVLVDDPHLDVRMISGRSPVKVVVDSSLRLPTTANVFQGQRLIVATREDVSSDRVNALLNLGVEVWRLPADPEGHVDLRALVVEAGRHELTSVLLEGGGRLAASALRAGIVDKVAIFIAPKLLGGDGVPSVGVLGLERLGEVMCFHRLAVECLGEDLLYIAYVQED
jgi:diaminohydroxyphosphoribosylaminopyrimidine deaminase/5-amino-6-(5-phosphoribosylamino)uracil reductase